MNTRPALAMIALIGLSACSSFGLGEDHFGCPGMPNGVQCMSTRQVYDLTNVRDHVGADNYGGTVIQSGRAGGGNGTPEADSGEARAVAAKAAATVDDRPFPFIADEGRVPIRTPSLVIRVWVASWETDDGDLNMPGYVYSEVAPRKWQIGNQTHATPTTLRPLEQSTGAAATKAAAN